MEIEMKDGPDYELKKETKKQTEMKDDGPNYELTDADFYKRLAAWTPFNETKNVVDNMPNRQYPIHFSKRVRDAIQSRMNKNSNSKSTKERFDLDCPAMREEMRRRIKWASYMKMKRTKRTKKDEGSAADDAKHAKAMAHEFMRRISWSCSLRDKCGMDALKAAAKLLNQAVQQVSSA